MSSFQVVRRQLNAHCLVHGERHPGPVRLHDSTTAAPLIGAIGTRNGWRYLTAPSGWSARAWSLSPSVSFPLQSCRRSAPLRLYVVRRMHYGQRFPSEIPSPIAYSNSGLTTPRRGVWRSGHIDPLVQYVCELYRVWLRTVIRFSHTLAALRPLAQAPDNPAMAAPQATTAHHTGQPQPATNLPSLPVPDERATAAVGARAAHPAVELSGAGRHRA